jgi:hypothetical protein
MSRSIRKTPIFGHAKARSEAADKRLWHKRWRAKERGQLANVSTESDHVTVHRDEVSSTWAMAKDGKSWLALSRQRSIAERVAAKHSQLMPERKKLQMRLLAKWRAK